jgi:hypothetical protein
MDSELMIAVVVLSLLAAALITTVAGTAVHSPRTTKAQREAVLSAPTQIPEDAASSLASTATQQLQQELPTRLKWGALLMKAWRDYFKKPSGPQTPGMIIQWWESRRLYYNVVILAAIILISLIMSLPAAVQGGRGYIESAAGLVAIGFVVLQLPANVWYTGGWVADLLVKKGLRLTALGFGPWAQAIGIVFSILFIAAMMITFFRDI